MLPTMSRPEQGLQKSYSNEKQKEEENYSFQDFTLDKQKIGKTSSYLYLPDKKETVYGKGNVEKSVSVTSCLYPSDSDSGERHASRTRVGDSTNDDIETQDSRTTRGSEIDSQNDDPNSEFTYPDGGWKAYSVCFGAFLGMIPGFGVMNATGAFESWIKSHQLKDAPSTDVSWIFAIFSFLAFGGCVYSGPLFDTFGSRPVGIPGAILMVAGLLATGNATETYQFILGFGVCVGVGSALLMAPIISCNSHWFLKRRGFAMGMSMTGASLGGMIIPLICNALYPKVGFAWTMRILALISGVLLCISLALLEDRVKEFNANDSRSLIQKMKDSIDLSALKDKRYVVLCLALFMNEFSLILCFTYISSYALSRGFSTSTSLVILTVVNAAGMVGRYVPSHLSDHLGKFNSILFCSLLMSFAIFVIWLPFGDRIAAFFVFGVIYGFSCAGTLSLTPSCTGQISGTRDFGKRYGTAYFFVSFGNLICIPAGMGIASSGTKQAFDHMVIFGGATCLAGSVFFLICRFLVGGKKLIA